MNERVLRAKYLDWCSARIAERFLELTPDEIYVLAQQATPESELPAGTRVSGALDEADRLASFRRVVMRVTEVLASTVTLPDFEAWRVEYSASPTRYDEEMLGFWKEAL